jgi:cytoskeleton protein RodZ
MLGFIRFINSRCVEAAGSLINPPKKNSLPELEALASSLRQAREARGLSREALADRLKMGVQQLEALESGNRDRLHEPVFVIAQARRISEVLEVNLDAPIEALRRSRAFHRTPRKPVYEPAQQPSAAPASARRIPRTVPVLLVVVAAVAAVLAALARNGRLPSVELRLGSTALKELSTPTPARNPAPPEQKPARSEAATPQRLKPQPDTLELTARGPSWLEVSTDDGKSLFHGLFSGRQSFPLGGGLRVLAGRPDLVMVQVGAAPPRPLGGVNDVDWRRFAPPPVAPSP